MAIRVAMRPCVSPRCTLKLRTIKRSRRGEHEPSPNLRRVPLRLTDSDRARLAREWMDSSMSQADFCAARGCSPRALREYITRFCAGPRPVARARAIIDRAIQQLQELRDALDVEAVANEHVDDDDVPVLGRHAEAAGCPDRPPSAAEPRVAADSEEGVRAEAAGRAEAEQVMDIIIGPGGAVERVAEAHPGPAQEHGHPEQQDLAVADQEHAAEVRPIPMPDPWRRPGGFFADV